MEIISYLNIIIKGHTILNVSLWLQLEPKHGEGKQSSYDPSYCTSRDRNWHFPQLGEIFESLLSVKTNLKGLIFLLAVRFWCSQLIPGVSLRSLGWPPCEECAPNFSVDMIVVCKLCAICVIYTHTQHNRNMTGGKCLCLQLSC